MQHTSGTNRRLTATPKIKLTGVKSTFILNGSVLPVLDIDEFYALDAEFVSVVGPSGCGKSTLLNIIAGLQEPEHGVVELEGQSGKDRLGNVGYMHQKDLLLPWRTVLDNAVLGLEVKGVARSIALEKAKVMMDKFGLKGFEASYPYTLSGGMRQRAAFLRTVLANQDVMLLDEPFGALDSITRVQMQEWLLQIWEELRRTVVMVTHDVEEALLLSDRVYVLTARPGQVKQVVEVDLPRPRHHQMSTTPAFVELKAKLMEVLYQEGLKTSPWVEENG